jgi:hypothetical protein
VLYRRVQVPIDTIGCLTIAPVGLKTRKSTYS